MISHKLVAVATALRRLLQRLQVRRLLVVALGAGLALPFGLATLPAQAGPAPQEGEVELLQNPGFEDGFYLWNGNNGLQIGTGWTPWWIDNSEHDPPYTRPEYSRVGADDAPIRVHSGGNAQQWFKLHSSYYAGVYQQVPEVTPEVGYRFSLWAQVWSSQEDEPEDVSSNPVNPHLQIGIDPQGNVDPFSADIIWSYEAGMHEVIDGWSQLTVEALARNSSVTVFVRSRPEFANKHNNVFIDSASLQVVVPPTATPTVPPPTFTATVTPTVAPSPTATATVVVTETVTAAPPTVAAAPTITSTTAVTPTRPAPTDTPVPEENPTQPPQPTAPPPTETEAAPPPPTATNMSMVTDTPPLPTETQAATEAARTATVTAEVAATETALSTGTAVAMVSPTAVAEVTAPAPAPEESGDAGSGRGLLCTAPILVIGLFGLALVLVRRRFLGG